MTTIQYVSNHNQILNDLASAVDASSDLLFEAVQFSVERTKNPFLAAAKGTPRQAVHPFVWSNDPAANERARRWYFAAIKRGDIPTDGTRYIRSGKFGNSFDIVAMRDGDDVIATFGSSASAASYIVGNADGSLQQIPGHRRTGWYEFDLLAEVWAEERIRETAERLAVLVEKSL